MRLPLSHWGFTVTPRGLALRGVPLGDLAERHGSPFYVFDEERLRENAQRALAAAKGAGLDARFFYSLKTNPHAEALAALRHEGLGAEVISAHEFELATATGWPGPVVVWNGPGKTDDDLALAVRSGALVHVESASEANALVRAARDVGRPARAGIRINPDVFEVRAQHGLRMGARGGVFGLDPAGEEFAEAVRVLGTSQDVDLLSLSAHVGTGITTVEPFAHMAVALARTRESLVRSGIAIRLLDVGGGFAVPSEVRYAAGAFDTLLPPADGRAVPLPTEVATFAECCTAIAKEIPDDVGVLFEPGRLLVADAFHLVMRVVRVKHEGGRAFAITNASRAQNALFVGRGFHETLHVDDPERPRTQRWTLAGPLCAGFDVFTEERLLPDFAEGDLVAVLDVGAYNLSAQSRWSFDPAPVVDLTTD